MTLGSVTFCVGGVAFNFGAWENCVEGVAWENSVLRVWPRGSVLRV